MVEDFNISKDKIIHKSIVLYGSSNSGKTTIIKDIVYILKDDVPLIIVFCPTEPSHNTYKQIIPTELIIYDIEDSSVIINFLEKQRERQTKISD